MKIKPKLCDACKSETLHAVRKRYSHKGMGFSEKREVDLCCRCGKKIIKTRKRGTYIIQGNNQIKEEK